MRSDGTAPIKIAADKGSLVGTPTWSPEGKRIAYVRTELAYDSPTRSIEVNEWEKASAQTLITDRHLTPALHWLTDDRLIYASILSGPPGQGTRACGRCCCAEEGKSPRPRNASRKGTVLLHMLEEVPTGKCLSP